MKDPILFICGATTATFFMIDRPIEALANLGIALAVSLLIGE